ncbi:solute carrier family 22 member 6-A-like, partial [Myiozetetes cayanensis]|uniref:solute carrier family 22 member 6-A-like n=1 Tax=Myiozetetes cayanensis TaxID=478635 RepID=UPI0021606D71
MDRWTDGHTAAPPRWLTESARWLLMVGRSQQALRALQKVAKINGRREEGDKLDIQTLRSQMQTELRAPRSLHPVLALVGTPRLRRISGCLCCVWFSTSLAYYGLAMDLQGFGVDIYVMQLIFGAVDIPAKLLSILTLTRLAALHAGGGAAAGRAGHPGQHPGATGATGRSAHGPGRFGKGSLAASFNCVFLYTGELYPTVI